MIDVEVYCRINSHTDIGVIHAARNVPIPSTIESFLSVEGSDVGLGINYGYVHLFLFLSLSLFGIVV